MSAVDRFVLEIIGLATRLYLAEVFLWASVAKIKKPPRLDEIIRLFYPRMVVHSRHLAHGIVLLEVILGILLVIGLFPIFMASLTATILVLYTAVLCIAWKTGYGGSCACFGHDGIGRVGPFHLVRNTLLAGFAVGVTTLAFLWPELAMPLWRSSAGTLFGSFMLVFAFNFIGILTKQIVVVHRKKLLLIGEVARE